ncbi:MAG TPA: hypothetical protein VLU43_09805 [Anaeromyxobacteraceae bacterium]|nr:hypothetical protein [Anaeromyxobacteraceae bacterium]
MTRTALAALLLAALPAVSRAQPRPPVAEDRQDLHQDRRALADDWRDLAWLEQLVGRFDAARAARDHRALLAVEDEVARALDREVHEQRAELDRDREEVRGDELRDDRRDEHQDRRALHEDRHALERLKQLRGEFAMVRGRMDRRGLDKARALLGELTELARREVREDQRRVGQDRRDLHQDAGR